jgi:signal transduction histidine kinase
VAAAVIVEVALIAGALLFVGVLRSTLTDGVRSTAEQDAAGVATQLDGTGPGGLVVDDDDDERFFQVLDDEGRVLAASENAADAAVAGPGDEPATIVLPGDDQHFAAAWDDEGDLSVVAGRTLEGVDDAVGTVTALLAVAVPLLGAAIALLCWVIVGRALRSVELLRREVGAIDAAGLDRRLDVSSHDEIGRLATTMNGMLDRLDRSQRAQRRFVSDASHELRSPLASLRQYAEVARDYPDRIDAGELAGAVLDEGARLEAIVRSMLLLTRVDEHALDAHPVDLDDLVLAEAARLRTTTSLTVDTSGVGALRVSGDAALLAQLLRNLADNAARHADARVAFALGSGLLAVDDDGPGIPPEERERVFERFVRLDEARSRDAGGSGLGLAIVRRIAEVHGGRVDVQESPLGGARFVLRLPAADQPPPIPHTAAP